MTGPGPRPQQLHPGTAVPARAGRSPRVQVFLLYLTVLVTLLGLIFLFAHLHQASLAAFVIAGCCLLAVISGMRALLKRVLPGRGDADRVAPGPMPPGRGEHGAGQHGSGQHSRRGTGQRGRHGHGQGEGRPKEPPPPWEPGTDQRGTPARQTDPMDRARQAGPVDPVRRSGPIGPSQSGPIRVAADIIDRPEAPGTVPGPPEFGVSTAGQAPWHLAGNASPSGLAADAGRLGDLEVRAASMVGAGHRCDEPADPRQDSYALGRAPDGQYLIIAVADGVGSARHSDIGARVAVTTATRELAKMLAAGGPRAIDPKQLYYTVAGEMLGTGRSRKLADNDICSILITAVIPTAPSPDGTRSVWAAWIGDVSLWTAGAGELRRMTGAEKSGLDRNQLSAVLPFSPDQYEEAQFELPPDARVAVMTDGLSDAFSDIPGVADYFARQWADPPPHPAVFLHSLCFDAPGQSDDRTAIVVWTGVSGPSPRRRRQ